MLHQGVEAVAGLWHDVDAVLHKLNASCFRSAMARFSRPRPAAIKPPFPRKVLFEMLEQRILLSASPTATTLTAGALYATFTSGND